MFAGAGPETFVVAQHGVLSGEPVGELGGQSLLVAVARPGAPLVGVVVQLFVDAVGGSVGVAGVDAHFAFVAVRDHRPRELAGPHRQPILAVDGVGERADRAAQFGGLQNPAGEVVISECSDSTHGEMVRPRLSYPETPKRFEALVELRRSESFPKRLSTSGALFRNLKFRYMSTFIQFLDIYEISALTGPTEPCSSRRKLGLWRFFDRNLLHSNVTREDLTTSRVGACAVVRPFDLNSSPECSLCGH